MKNTVCYIINILRNKFSYLFLCVVLFSFFVILGNNCRTQVFQSVEEAYEYFNKCEVNLMVEGEKSVLALGMKDGEIIRDFFYRGKDGYSSSFGFDSDTVFCEAVDGFSCDVLYVKKADEYYIKVYSSVGELPCISDSCDSVFYSLQPFPSNITKAKIYYAFVKDFNDNYYLKINDELTFIRNRKTGNG